MKVNKIFIMLVLFLSLLSFAADKKAKNSLERRLEESRRKQTNKKLEYSQKRDRKLKALQDKINKRKEESKNALLAWNKKEKELPKKIEQKRRMEEEKQNFLKQKKVQEKAKIVEEENYDQMQREFYKLQKEKHENDLRKKQAQEKWAILQKIAKIKKKRAERIQKWREIWLLKIATWKKKREDLQSEKKVFTKQFENSKQRLENDIHMGKRNLSKIAI